MVDGYWNLSNVIENEVKFRDVPLDYVLKTIITIQSPQALSDRDINILYNACDIGVNSADGEGFGLCGFEGLALGKAQVSAYVGGMREFLNDNISIIIKPKINIYLDNKSNGIGGVAELTDPHEYAEAFWKYLSNPELVEKHGYRGRQHILTNYKWENMIDYLYKRITPGEVSGEWVFNQPFFIILNIAVGGNFVGPPNEFTPFPGTMTIDYVRAYKEK